jgi:hypothetical protein
MRPNNANINGARFIEGSGVCASGMESRTRACKNWPSVGDNRRHDDNNSRMACSVPNLFWKNIDHNNKSDVCVWVGGSVFCLWSKPGGDILRTDVSSSVILARKTSCYSQQDDSYIVLNTTRLPQVRLNYRPWFGSKRRRVTIAKVRIKSFATFFYARLVYVWQQTNISPWFIYHPCNSRSYGKRLFLYQIKIQWKLSLHTKHTSREGHGRMWLSRVVCVYSCVRIYVCVSERWERHRH